MDKFMELYMQYLFHNKKVTFAAWDLKTSFGLIEPKRFYQAISLQT